MEAIYDAGARGSFDVAALHPYTGKPKNVIRIVKIVRRVMARHRDPKVPLWVTELSWPAAEGKTVQHGDFETTDAGQNRRLAAGLPLLAEQRRTLRIERVYWYTWLSAESPDSVFAWSGLRRLREDGTVVSARSLRAYRRTAQRLRR
jgi:hypothetical protein